MRNSGTRGYSGYRGRRPSGRKWLVLALVLIILAAAAFLIAQRYMVYDMDGSYHFELPWSRRGGDAQTTLRRGFRQELEIVIEEPDVPEEEPVRAQELDVSALQGGMTRALEALPEEINAVAIRLKNTDGELLYPSALPAAIEAKAVAGGSIARTSIETLTGSDRYAIAMLSALHDSRYSVANRAEAAILQRAYRGNIWYAPDSTFYLAPEKEAARQYLAGIAAEVAALGFDELLFDEFGYPAAGRLGNIMTDDRDMTQQEALALLASNLREAISEYGAKLSVVMDEQTVLAGGNETTGQDVPSLARVFDRIYVPTTEENVPALREALAPYGAELVPILETAPAEGGYLIAQ